MFFLHFCRSFSPKKPTFLILLCFLDWMPFETDLTLANFSQTSGYDPLYYWTQTPTNEPDYTTCNGTSIVGGYMMFYGNQAVQRNYLDVPQHTSIRVAFSLYILDNWNNDCINVFYDGVDVSTNCFNESTSETNLCGNNTYGDQIIAFTHDEPHNATSFTLEIMSNIISVNDSGLSVSWGFRNLTISVDCFPLCNECTGNVL